MTNQDFTDVHATTIKSVMEQRCLYYNGQIGKLRDLAESSSVETISKDRQSLLQGMAVDIGSDLSLITKVSLEVAGSPYYKDMLGNYSYYLKDLLGVLRLYVSAETRSNFI